MLQDKIRKALDVLEALQPHSRWNLGVRRYAVELLTDLQEGMQHGYISEEDLGNRRLIDKAFLNGADS